MAHWKALVSHMLQFPRLRKILNGSEDLEAWKSCTPHIISVNKRICDLRKILELVLVSWSAKRLKQKS